ncbi:MAG: transglycosylase SLT domain-containing protein [Chlorobiaceae bacterium]|nr:transglycosylase SLT domain-containing protein [Chlorobiaceae bacterium]
MVSKVKLGLDKRSGFVLIARSGYVQAIASFVTIESIAPAISPVNPTQLVKILFQFRLLFLCVLLQVTAFPCVSSGADQETAQSARQSGVSEMLGDSLLNTTYFQDDRFSSAEPGGDIYPRQFIPQFSDSVYTARIGELAKKTQFKLIYNQHVKGFIRVYAVDKRKMVSKVLGLTKVYFPLFEEKLREHNIPSEMKYLAVVESALNPTAVSRAGARGLWQFMSGTGKMYGLQSSSFIEDRYDPYKETVAACEHLHDLYNMFGDWFLVLAAYNAGAGNVQKAIRAAGGARDYWEIWPYLPQETRGYVPAFIAVTYVMNYYREHNIKPAEPGYLYSDTERIPVNAALSFEQLQETLGVPIDDLKFLNPQYKIGLIPAPAASANMLRLPKKYVQAFTQKEQEIYAYHADRVAEKQRLYSMVRNMEDEGGGSGSTRKAHVVRKGETIAGVARKYGIAVSQLIAWNELKSGKLKPGQKLVVFKAVKYRSSSKASSSRVKGKKGVSKAKAVKGGKVHKAAKGKGKAVKAVHRRK